MSRRLGEGAYVFREPVGDGVGMVELRVYLGPHQQETFVSHSHTKKITSPASAPYVLW